MRKERKDMAINLIAAVSENSIIGVNGELPWIIPEDLKHFKQMTTGKTIVMGWKTWVSLGEKPLPGRLNVIVSRWKKKVPRSSKVKLINDPMKALKFSKDIWVIGGESMYRYFLPLADMMYLTKIYIKITKVPGDRISLFPNFTDEDWQLVDGDYHPVGDGISYNFMTYKNINLNK